MKRNIALQYADGRRSRAQLIALKPKGGLLSRFLRWIGRKPTVYTNKDPVTFEPISAGGCITHVTIINDDGTETKVKLGL